MAATNPDSMKMIAKVVYTSGFIFAVLGTVCLAYPQLLENYTDPDTSRLIAGALLTIGICDFFIARFLFDKVKTQ